ncbi:MAG: AAA family ATPase [Deltaproteobacteria bacterium]
MTASKSEINKILLLGSDVRIVNLPIKEVSLLHEGSLPAYGYNPGDFIELLAGEVSIERGRLDQCLTWLTSYLRSAELTRQIHTFSYGEQKEVYQIFRHRGSTVASLDHGWFMFQQILPPEGRCKEACQPVIDPNNEQIFFANEGIMVVDDSGRPPDLAQELKERNPKAWVVGMGIGVAHWQKWARYFGEDFCLFCRLSDLETTRMEMDSSVTWESIVAMSLRALRTPEVGLWDSDAGRFLCQVVVEMYPHGILFLGTLGVFFRHRKNSLPEKSSPRHKGSVPCYDTMATSLLIKDAIQTGGFSFCRNYFFDYSTRLLKNWQLLHQHGYAFDRGLKFPDLDFSSTFPGGVPCSFMEIGEDPCFIELPLLADGFDRQLELVADQSWNREKKDAVRSFFPREKSKFSRESGRSLPADYRSVIVEVLHYLKEEVSWQNGFDELRLFQVGNLRTTDTVEVEPVVTLQKVMASYVAKERVQRPLCVGVFGPPGSGKSFAVKEVARVVARKYDNNPFEYFEFNLTQFEGPEEINAAIEPIRASVAKGKVPIVFWDEFDCPYGGYEFGYLRYFLPSMQDGVTYVHGVPYNIGRSIFVFAGGVKASWEGMEALLDEEDYEAMNLVRTLKIPDFMGRLRVVLDIDGIDIADNLLAVGTTTREHDELRRVLLKRAFIIAHQMDTHWKKAARKTSGLLLRLLLQIISSGLGPSKRLLRRVALLTDLFTVCRS